MHDTLRVFASIAGGIGLGQIVLFWVTRRSRQFDARAEQALNLENSFLAERRELLTCLHAQLLGEQGRVARLETEKMELGQQLIALHKIANEVVAKYDFLRSLNPDANLPSIRLDSPLPSPAPDSTPNPAEANLGPQP